MGKVEDFAFEWVCEKQGRKGKFVRFEMLITALQTKELVRWMRKSYGYIVVVQVSLHLFSLQRARRRGTRRSEGVRRSRQCQLRKTEVEKWWTR